ncbi:alpha/beta hydrolase [Pseudonocardia sp. KRD-184]|uniref:Alpha/beta hydrolase n=1 Tax=Pseudonocardia oceani TaxID=2792013 RepID=A0ABS6U458_9PSEU|nr:alpha/beta hydrolase [Pseudonocardia oceani]MBW0127022.1 alpha/beta hydrolase [Pseudonocardia oceani]
MSWDRAGTGEPLLLLHGIGSTHDDFAALRPRLDARYQVLAPDLPGHGRSAPLDRRPTVAAIADAIEADLDDMGAGPVHVLGNSLGGRVALELAVRGRARSVVALSPSGANLPVERLYQGTALAVARSVLRAVRPLVPAAGRWAVGRSVLLAGLRTAPWRAGEAEVAGLDGGFAGASQFWSMLWWGVLTDLPRGLERIDCPVILAQGTLDVIASGQTPRFLFAVPGARFVPLFGAGHAPQSDAPGAILQLVHRAVAAALPATHPGAAPDG